MNNKHLVCIENREAFDLGKLRDANKWELVYFVFKDQDSSGIILTDDEISYISEAIYGTDDLAVDLRHKLNSWNRGKPVVFVSDYDEELIHTGSIFPEDN